MDRSYTWGLDLRARQHMTEPFVDAESFIDHLEQLFEGEGPTALEVLSIAAHMLQTAAAANAAKANDSLVAAALLHDIGHWVDLDADLAVLQDADRRHEDVGAAYLSAFFGPEVYKPVQLHVAAKRYLCAAEPDYFACLSSASVHTLELQGGPMSKDEVKAFESIPEHRNAVALRRWDEYGKQPDLGVPAFTHYRELLASLVVRGQSAKQ